MSSPVSAIALTGGRFNSDPTISVDKVLNIRDARRQSEAYSCFDRIKDWFCGTHRVEAQKKLYQVFHSKNNEERMIAFIDLSKMAAEPYRKNFHMDIRQDGMMNLSIREGWNKTLVNIHLRNEPDQFVDFHYRDDTPRQVERSDLATTDTMGLILSRHPDFNQDHHYNGCRLHHSFSLVNELVCKTYEIDSLERTDEGVVNHTHELTVYNDDYDRLFLGELIPCR